jgi:hypothetical protein
MAWQAAVRGGTGLLHPSRHAALVYVLGCFSPKVRASIRTLVEHWHTEDLHCEDEGGDEDEDEDDLRQQHATVMAEFKQTMLSALA